MQIYPNSLAKTVESVEEAQFFGKKVARATKEEVASWIASRQGLQGSYADMFAPTTYDIKNGVRLFTGEVIRSGASLRHVSGEEACRALVHLNPSSKTVKQALQRATTGMSLRLENCGGNKHGMFCCGTCDPALWRNITVGGLSSAEKWLVSGMKALKAHRDNQGSWRRFPFFYTLLALLEIDSPAARDEMKYAASKCERYLARNKPTRLIVQRRIAVAERVLELPN